LKNRLLKKKKRKKMVKIQTRKNYHLTQNSVTTKKMMRRVNKSNLKLSLVMSVLMLWLINSKIIITKSVNT